MHCPVCNHKDSRVVDSRLTAGGIAIRRRRVCPKCHFRFSTTEQAELLDLTVIKRNGRRESYDREKMVHGLRKALEKRPVTEDDFRRLVSHIERDIQKKRKDELTSRELGEIVMERLKAFDSVAYIRFASVYRSFKDVSHFAHELKRLKKYASNHPRRPLRARRKKR